MRRRLVDRVRGEDGFAMVVVVLLTSVLVLVSISIISLVSNESTRAVATSRGGTALQAAEAGLGDYLAKLVEDKTYYLHEVHPAESSRLGTSGSVVDPSDTCLVDKVGAVETKTVTIGGAPASSAGLAWSGSTTWSSPNGKDNWCQLPNGYEYNLQVTAPAPGSPYIKIVATGRPTGQTANTGQWRALEEWVHFLMVSDYQMITASNYSADSSAVTNGKVYASGTLVHDGVANANLYSEAATPTVKPTTLQNGAMRFGPSTSPTIRSQPGLAQPINFANFQTSLDDVKRVAQYAGRYFDTSAPAWRLIFLNNGKFTAAACTTPSGNPGQYAATCGAATTYDVPVNGAIFVETAAVISGTVNGRVTVATNGDGIIAGNIDYVASGDDVLGVIAKQNVIVAKYAPTTLSWRAAVIAQNGRRRSWESWCQDPPSAPCVIGSSATHNGSTASYLNPYMNQFDNRTYDYDTTLQYLPPPWFPALEDTYRIDLFREVTP